MSESCGSPPTLDNVVGNVCPSSEFLRQGAPRRVSLRVDADHPPPTHDAVNARHRTVQVEHLRRLSINMYQDGLKAVKRKTRE